MKGTSHGRALIRPDTYDTGDHVDLSAEVLGIVAKHLLYADSYGTCAAINVCNKALYNETLSDLWKKLVLWTAKIYAEVPESFCESVEFHRKPSDEEKVREKRILKSYEGMKSAPGAAYSQ